MHGDKKPVLGPWGGDSEHRVVRNWTERAGANVKEGDKGVGDGEDSAEDKATFKTSEVNVGRLCNATSTTNG